jgi:hypothetical protein
MVLSKSLQKSDDYSSEEAIAAAKRVLDNRQDFLWHRPTELESQFNALGLFDFGDRLASLETALDEITAQCRSGPQPPGDFSSGAYAGKRMYAFVWNSTEFGPVYIKFSFTGADRMASLVLHSFHKDTPKGS